MDVGNSTWQLVGQGSDAKLIVQNVGVSRIAYVFATTQPGPEALGLESDEHGLFDAGQPPLTITGLDTDTMNLYVRALGSKNGKLYVYDPAA